MEATEQIIAHLKDEIKARDSDIHLAATYGKQLFEEKNVLSSKYDELNTQKEVLEQEKHSLQFELDSQIQTVKSLTSEIEFQRDRADELLEKLQITEKENEAMHKKIQNLLKENQYLKKVQEDLNVENKSFKDQIILQDKLIKNFQEQAEKSVCEIDKEESFDIQAQLNTYMLNNKELTDALSQAHLEVEKANKNENHLLQMIKDLEENISDRDAEIRTHIAEGKTAKEEIEELKGEIELLKYNQIDTNRRGNSVFAELDDRRSLVEREYKKLQKKYEHFKKDYDVNKTELDRARGQMAILQSMSSRGYQQSYIDRLEDSLSSAKKEIQDLTHKLSKALKSTTEVGMQDVKLLKGNEYDYLRVMLLQSQKKEKELQNEVMTLRMTNINNNDKLSVTQQLLYKTKQDLDSAKQEIVCLKLKIKEVELGIIENQGIENEARKPKVEVLEEIKPASVRQKTEKVNIADVSLFHDMSMIPGELELDDDGFRQVRPPRKSNKFILQEFNRVEKDEENSEGVPQSSRKSELLKNMRNEEKVAECDENERLKLKRRNFSKASSARRNDGCAQQ